MTRNSILIEGFGAPINEDLLADDVSDVQEVVAAAIDELDDVLAGGIESFDALVSGMNASVTHALEDIVEERDLDVEVEPFYPNINNIMEEDGLEYQDAWQEGFTWRNNKCFVADEDDDEQTLVNLTVRLGDAGNSGEELLRHSRRKGVNSMDINLDDMIDRDAAYGDAEADADAEAEAAA